MTKTITLLTLLLLAAACLPPAAPAQTASVPELVVQTGHTFGVFSASFSPDGRTLAAASGPDIKLWNVASRRELRSLVGHTSAVTSVAFSPVTNTLASGSNDKTIKLWDVESGAVVRTFVEPAVVEAVTFTGDGKTLVSRGANGTVRFWDVTYGRELRSLSSACTNLVACRWAVSPDGGRIALTMAGTNIDLWDVNGPRLLRNFALDNYFLAAMTFSPDGRTLAASLSPPLFFLPQPAGPTIKLWDVESGGLLHALAGNFQSAMAFSPDGRTLAVSGSRPADPKKLLEPNKNVITLWDVGSGSELRTIDDDNQNVFWLSYSPDGRTLASAGTDRAVRLREAGSGRELGALAGVSLLVNSVTFGEDGRSFTGGGAERALDEWDKRRKAEFASRGQLPPILVTMAISADGRIVAAPGNGTVDLYDAQSGKQLRALPKIKFSISSIAFSGDGSTVAAREYGRIILWEVGTGRHIRDIEGVPAGVGSLFTPLRLSHDGRTLACGIFDTIRLWDVGSGETRGTLTGHSAPLVGAAFSPDGRTLATGDTGSTVKLWDLATGKELKSFAARSSPRFLGFSPDGRILAGGSGNVFGLWDVAARAELCGLYILDNGQWLAATPDGRFDTNGLEDPGGLNWVIGDSPLTAMSFEIFMRDYFEPKLLTRLLRCVEENDCGREFKAIRDLTSLNRTQPLVRIVGVRPSGPRGEVEVTAEVSSVGGEGHDDWRPAPPDSGAYDLRLFRDGQLVGHSTEEASLQGAFRTYQSLDDELKAWRDANRIALTDGRKTFTFKVKLPHADAGRRVEFTAYAFNSDRVKSETARVAYDTPERPGGPGPRRAYVLTFGVNKFDDPKWDLRYAANDARAIRQSVSAGLRARKEFAEVVEVQLISDDETAGGRTVERRDATKGNLRTALELLAGRTPPARGLKDLGRAIGAETLRRIRQAEPDDMVLIALSSHGYADRNGVFYVLPSDTGRGDGGGITAALLRRSISTDELSLWLRDVDAGEMVMIVDACHAASAVEGGEFKPGPMGSRGMGQLAYDKGMRVLAASQADDVALEVRGLGHGMLTYALVREGLGAGKADADGDGMITLDEWVAYGERRVPALYAEMRGGRLSGLQVSGRDPVPVKILGARAPRRGGQFQQPSLFDFKKHRRPVILAGG